jgi:hypothetical protein
MFNGETRPRAPTPMPARPSNDKKMEPEGPRMRSISLDTRVRPFFEVGDGAAAPPPVYVPAARPLGNLPKIQMPEFQGKKGVPAQMWLESITRFQNLYQLTDAQLLEVARFSCQGEYAALWAGLLPADLTLPVHDFKELIKAEFAVENHDKLMGELLKATQKGLVGEYATDMMRYFKVLDLGEEARVRHFVRGLKFGIKETVMAFDPTSFLQAVKKAKEVEQAYELGDNCPPPDGLNGRIEDQVVRAVRQEMNHFKTSNRDRDAWGERRPDPRSEARAAPKEPARANERPRGRSPERNPPVNQTSARPPPPPARPPVNEPASGDGFNGRCPRCLQREHRVCKCPNPSAVPRNDCCTGGMKNMSLVVHKQLPRIGSALPTSRARRVWLMWSWAQSPFCRTLWKSMTIGWTLSFIRILPALLSLPLVTSVGQGLLMVDASVAPRAGIKLVTAPIGGTCPKTIAVQPVWKTFNGLHAGLCPKQGSRAERRAREGQD